MKTFIIYTASFDGMGHVIRLASESVRATSENEAKTRAHVCVGESIVKVEVLN